MIYFKFSKCHHQTIIIVCFFALLCCSCNSAKLDETQNYPTITKNILDQTNDLLNGGQTKQAEIFLDSSFSAFPQAGPIDLSQKYNHQVNFYLNYEFNLGKARLYADSLTAIIKDRKDTYKNNYAEAIFTNGDVLMAEKKYAEAFKHYYDGREFVKKNLGICDISVFTSKLGLVRYRQGQYLKAVPYLQQALTENNKCRDSSSLNFEKYLGNPQSLLNTIALCYEKSGITDSAVVYYKKTITLIDQQENNFPDEARFTATAKGVIYGNLGGSYSILNNYTEAEKHLKKSIQINDRIGYEVQDAQTAKIKLADLYIRFSHLKEANQLLNEVQAHLALPGKNPANENIRLKWHKLKWLYFNKTNDITLAYAYLKKYHAIQDSISTISKVLKNADMDVAFRESEQQHKLILLKKDSELKTGYLIAAIIFLALVIFVLMVVWRNRRRLKKLNTKVTLQNTDMHTALSALEQSQQENTNMMKIVAHDLRSPMAATISIASMLLENDNLPPEDREMLKLMETSSLHSLEMIADLLNINTTAEGLKKESVEMHTLLRYCVSLLKFKAAEKKQKIILQTSDIMLNVNREKIWRVISNLIVNAIKFSPVGSAIYIQLQQEENNVKISIQDHGIGIPEELGNKIFNMYTDARRPGTLGEQSFGLGLAISQQIVEAHGGKIWFEGNIDGGTTFYVALPFSIEHLEIKSAPTLHALV